MAEASGDAGRVESLVAAYAGHVQDGAHVRRNFRNSESAVGVLAEMRGSGDRGRVNAAALVLRDAALLRYVPGLWHLLPRSGVLAALRANLRAPHYGIRQDSIYTLGKLTYPREAEPLRRVFPLYLERYPLELARLLFELFWLSARERRRRWEYLDAVARAPHYLVRWSVFEAAGHGWVASGRHTRDARLYRRLLRRLAQDPHPLVRGEARERLASARRARNAGRKWEGAQEIPTGTAFGEVAIRFGNYLWVSGRADYDLTLLDRFARYVASGAAGAAIDGIRDRNDPAEWEAAVLAFDPTQVRFFCARALDTRTAEIRLASTHIGLFAGWCAELAAGRLDDFIADSRPPGMSQREWKRLAPLDKDSLALGFWVVRG